MRIIKMEDVTTLEFFNLLKTKTMIEQRIRLILKNSKSFGFTFNSGQLSEGNVHCRYVKVDGWELSLEETIEVMQNLTETLEMKLCTPERITFSDSIMELAFTEY